MMRTTVCFDVVGIHPDTMNLRTEVENKEVTFRDAILSSGVIKSIERTFKTFEEGRWYFLTTRGQEAEAIAFIDKK